MNVVFAVIIVLGFALWLAATWPGPPWTERAARACFLVAAIIWAISGFRGG